MTVRAAKLRVAGQQCDIEYFGQRDVGRIVCGHRITQLPYPLKKADVRKPLDSQIQKVLQDLATSPSSQLLEPDEPTQALRDLNVQQLGSRQLLLLRECPSLDLPATLRL